MCTPVLEQGASAHARSRNNGNRTPACFGLCLFVPAQLASYLKDIFSRRTGGTISEHISGLRRNIGSRLTVLAKASEKLLLRAESDEASIFQQDGFRQTGDGH
jgi:hypothetical protein